MTRINCSPKVAVVGALILFATAVCYAQEPAPAPTPAPSPTAAEPAVASTHTKARIYFYRIKQFAGSALEPSVYCDDKELARMDNGRFFAVDLEPGELGQPHVEDGVGLPDPAAELSRAERRDRATIETWLAKGVARVILGTVIADAQGCAESGRLHRVSLRVYNLLAQLVAVPVLQGGAGNAAGGEPLENLLLTCSEYEAYWNGKYSQTGEDVASGIYLWRLEVDGKVLVKKMIVRK